VAPSCSFCPLRSPMKRFCEAAYEDVTAMVHGEPPRRTTTASFSTAANPRRAIHGGRAQGGLLSAGEPTADCSTASGQNFCPLGKIRQLVPRQLVPRQHCQYVTVPRQHCQYVTVPRLSLQLQHHLWRGSSVNASVSRVCGVGCWLCFGLDLKLRTNPTDMSLWGFVWKLCRRSR
jgi:hypothetical protein